MRFADSDAAELRLRRAARGNPSHTRVRSLVSRGLRLLLLRRLRHGDSDCYRRLRAADDCHDLISEGEAIGGGNSFFVVSSAESERAARTTVRGEPRLRVYSMHH